MNGIKSNHRSYNQSYPDSPHSSTRQNDPDLLLHKYAFSYIYIRTLETYCAAATSAPPVIFITYTI